MRKFMYESYGRDHQSQCQCTVPYLICFCVCVTIDVHYIHEQYIWVSLPCNRVGNAIRSSRNPQYVILCISGSRNVSLIWHSIKLHVVWKNGKDRNSPQQLMMKLSCTTEHIGYGHRDYSDYWTPLSRNEKKHLACCSLFTVNFENCSEKSWLTKWRPPAVLIDRAWVYGPAASKISVV